MRFPQVLIYEKDGRIAELLRRDSKSRQWSVREPRRLETCLRLLRRGGPSVFILKVGSDLLQELDLLDRVSWLFPDTVSVVVSDTDNPVLAGLAWDLGAAVVLFPPQPRQYLTDILDRLLEPPVCGRSVAIVQDENSGSSPPPVDS
jgi:DNA-binding NtrC family response regulator